MACRTRAYLDSAVLVLPQCLISGNLECNEASGNTLVDLHLCSVGSFPLAAPDVPALLDAGIPHLARLGASLLALGRAFLARPGLAQDGFYDSTVDSLAAFGRRRREGWMSITGFDGAGASP